MSNYKESKNNLYMNKKEKAMTYKPIKRAKSKNNLR